MSVFAKRKVLENVPKVCFYEGHRCPEDVPFPSCVRAYLEYIGDESFTCKNAKTGTKKPLIDCVYSYLLGTSGGGFRLSWDTREWNMDNGTIHYCSSDASEPFHRAMKSIGYDCELISRHLHNSTEADLKIKIIESINKGRPVIAFGVIGPPEPGLITGYDEDGDVMIGWSFFQSFREFTAGVEFEPSGYCRKRDWFDTTEALMIVGDKQEDPQLDKICRDSLEFALKVVRTPMHYPSRANGLAAYDAWADTLLRDEDFATDDKQVLFDRYMVHFDAVGTVAEGRWYAHMFLDRVAREIPAMAEDLKKAAQCYVDEHDLMWAVWEFAGGNGVSEEHARKLADPGVRRRIAPLIRISRKLDAEAADHIERALVR